MLRKFILTGLAAFIAMSFFAGCEDDSTPLPPNVNPGDSEPGNDNFFGVEGEYTNATGDSARFVPTEIHTSIHLGASEISTEHSGNIVDVILNNVSISDSITYNLDSVSVKEDVNGFNVFPEFSVSDPIPLTEIAIVLVLDVSESLGEDFVTLKEFAKGFASDVKNESASARIGVVAFATKVQSLELTSNLQGINAYIDDLRQGQFTALYDGMQTAIEILNDSNVASEAKAIITFTDGRDNASNLAVNNELSVARALQIAQIKSFTLGLDGKGGVDGVVLDSLAVGGSFQKADDIETVRSIFKDFSKAVSNFYRVIYSRNNQIIVTPRKMRFEFYVTPKS